MARDTVGERGEAAPRVMEEDVASCHHVGTGRGVEAVHRFESLLEVVMRLLQQNRVRTQAGKGSGSMRPEQAPLSDAEYQFSDRTLAVSAVPEGRNGSLVPGRFSPGDDSPGSRPHVEIVRAKRVRLMKHYH